MFSYTRQGVEQSRPLEQHADAGAQGLHVAATQVAMSWSKTFTVPLLRHQRPVMCLMSTDLPEPDPPMTTVICLAGMSRSMPFNT
jgi:hypothetical protein